MTGAEAEDYRRLGLKTPVAVVPYGVDVPAALSPDLFQERFPALKERRLILFLGRIHYKKGVDLLCRAWARLCGDFPEAHLVLAGPDYENTQVVVEVLIRKLGIGERVSFTGMLSAGMKWSALAAAEVFVLPSFSEGLPVAMLEAMGAGRPVIVSRQCYAPEVKVCQCGLVIEPDAGQLEEALRQVLSMRAEALRMGENGRSLVAERYAWRETGRQMADVYEWLLGGPRPQVTTIV